MSDSASVPLADVFDGYDALVRPLGRNVVFVVFIWPVAAAQKLKPLTRVFDALVMRFEGSKILDLLQRAGAIIHELLTGAKVDKDRGQVTMILHREEHETLVEARPYLLEYQLLRESDALQKPKQKGGRR